MIGKYRGTILHYGQPKPWVDKIKCSKFLGNGHKAGECDSGWRCRISGVPSSADKGISFTRTFVVSFVFLYKYLGFLLYKVTDLFLSTKLDESNASRYSGLFRYISSLYWNRMFQEIPKLNLE
jgi:hypothetical protein